MISPPRPATRQPTCQATHTPCHTHTPCRTPCYAKCILHTHTGDTAILHTHINPPHITSSPSPLHPLHHTPTLIHTHFATSPHPCCTHYITTHPRHMPLTHSCSRPKRQISPIHRHTILIPLHPYTTGTTMQPSQTTHTPLTTTDPHHPTHPTHTAPLTLIPTPSHIIHSQSTLTHTTHPHTTLPKPTHTMPPSHNHMPPHSLTTHALTS